MGREGNGTLMGNGLRRGGLQSSVCMHPVPNWINAAATGKEARRENMLSTMRYLPISSATLARTRALHKQGVHNNAKQCRDILLTEKDCRTAAERKTALYYALVSPIGDASLAIRHGG